MRQKILAAMANSAAKHPVWIVIITLLITVLAAGLSERLTLTMQFKNLMPQDHPMVKEFNQIVDNYQTASLIIIAAKGPEAQLKQFADRLAPRVEGLDKYIQRVEYKLERPFFEEHGLMLQKTKDLKNNREIFSNLNLLPWLTALNNSFEKTYVQDEESISSREKEDGAIRMLDGIEYWLNAMGLYAAGDSSATPELARRAVDHFLIGEEYFLSQDKDMLLIFAQPNFTINEVDKVIEAVNTIDGLIAEVGKDFPNVFAGITGTMALTRDETTAVNSDMYYTSLVALLLIIALFIISFRMWTAPLLSGITLLVGIIWTAGFTAVVVGSLNIFTSMFSVILIGLGVDFSIHIIAVYTENRAAGKSIADSLLETLLKSGNGIIIGALSTAAAFYTLMISKTVGMSEFGLVAGSGVIFCMLATLLLLPALLSLRDRILIRLRKDRYQVRSTSFHFLGRGAEVFSRRPVLILSTGILLSIALFWSASKITFDYNYLNMEPVGLTSIKLQHEMEDKFDITPDFATITTRTVEDARQITEAAKDLKMIGMVNSISEYLPAPKQQAERRPILQEIRSKLSKTNKPQRIRTSDLEPLLNQLFRLEDNIIELAQLAYLGGQDRVDKKCRELIGNLESPGAGGKIAELINQLQELPPATVAANLNRFQSDYIPSFRKLSFSMASPGQLTLSDLPGTIRRQFVSNDGEKFLVTIYPKETVWNIEFLERFTNRMQELDERVTGMPLVFYVLMDIIARDGRIAAMLTLLVIFLLLLIDFRRLGVALMAMLPLLLGAVWMIGLMQLFGLQLTMVNIMGLPLILGIGIDDGVHILHRYRVEGNGKIRTVFTSTGRAILLTSLTTMLAFGSLVFATYRGMGSLGTALFIGVGSCFLTTVFFIPALLGLVNKHKTEKRKEK